MIVNQSLIDGIRLDDSAPQCKGSRIPGVCGQSQEWLQLIARGPAGMLAIPSTVLSTPTAAVSAINYTLPTPSLSTNKALIARISTWQDTLPSKLKETDVQQQEIYNCYLAATLAALAHTPKGRALVQKIVTEKTGRIVTTCHDYDFSGTKGPKKMITSNRYFVVKFHSGLKLTVSDVLYMDDSDRNWSPRFMTSPNSVLWPCVIEAAYALYKGGYNKIDASNNLTINDFLKDLIGPKVVMLHCESSKKWQGGKSSKLTEADLKAACNNANSIPVVGASRNNATSVTGWHGFAVLGLNRSTVTLYDPLAAKVKQLSLKQLWNEFQALFILNV